MAMARLIKTTSLQIMLCCDYWVQSHNTDQSSAGAGFKYLTSQQTGLDDLDTQGQKEEKPMQASNKLFLKIKRLDNLKTFFH